MSGVFTIDIDGAGIAMIGIFYSNTPVVADLISEGSRVCIVHIYDMIQTRLRLHNYTEVCSSIYV